MTLWIAVAVLVIVGLVPLLLPLLRPPSSLAGRLDHDIEVYRDQLAEVDADVQRGVISESEASEARREIERRILKAADLEKDAAKRASSPSTVMAVALTLLLPGAALLIYGAIGSPSEPARPFAQRGDVAAPSIAQRPHATSPQTTAASGQELPSLETMAARLATKLESNPENAQDWALLGRTYWQLGRFEDAAQALRRAVTLRGDVAALQSAYGEALTQAAEGRVTPDALAAFRAARQLDNSHPAARFYLALAARQSGDAQAAYDGWLSLIRELPADNPGRAAVLAQLQDVATELGVELDSDMASADGAVSAPEQTQPPRGPTREDMQAAAEMSSEDRMEMIRSMVQRLADRLEESPNDPDGWSRLGRAYGVLNEREKAVDAYKRAAALLPAGSAKRQAVEQAITALGG